MSDVRSYLESDVQYFTTCKCGKRIDFVARFNLATCDIVELVHNKFKWTLFPSRCPECQGKMESK